MGVPGRTEGEGAEPKETQGCIMTFADPQALFPAWAPSVKKKNTPNFEMYFYLFVV